MTMAHVGKFWKLHFRRDALVNCVQHNRSWPEAFLLECALHFSGPQQPSIIIAPTVAPCVTPYDKWPAEWRTAPMNIKGSPCTVRFKFIGWDFVGGVNLTELSIWNSSHRLCHIAPTQVVGGSAASFDITGSFGRSMIVDDPGFWGSTAIDTAGTERPARWNQWPP